jgi:hypothetical protein
MAFSTSYKRLVEVRCLHSFYLENGADGHFYTLTEEEKAEHIAKIRYDIRNDIGFEPTEGAKLWLEAHHAILVPTLMGFVIAIEVNGDKKPKVDLPKEWRIGFKIVVKNADFLTFTNVKMRPNILPARFFWTNDKDILTKKMPSLSAPLKPFENTAHYEMGEWTLKSSVPQQALSHNNKWIKTVPYNDYTHEGDRRVLAKQFRFKIPISDVVQCIAVLTKAGDTKFKVQKTVNGTEGPLSIMDVDFRFDKNQKPIIDGMYNVEFQCFTKNLNNDVVKKFDNIVLRDELTGDNSRFWGLVELVQAAGLPNGQNILNAGDVLIDGGRVFELRFQNRSTHWQFREGRKGSLTPYKNGAILDNELATKQAFTLTRTSKPIDVGDNVKLPSPSRLTIRDKNDRYYTDVVF